MLVLKSTLWRSWANKAFGLNPFCGYWRPPDSSLTRVSLQKPMVS
jgi:hypothetical protein